MTIFLSTDPNQEMESQLDYGFASMASESSFLPEENNFRGINRQDSNSFDMNDSGEWDFFDTDNEEDDIDANDTFLAIHPNGDEHRGEIEATQHQQHPSQRRHHQRQQANDVDLNSRERRKKLVASALDIAICPSDVDLNSRESRRKLVASALDIALCPSEMQGLGERKKRQSRKKLVESAIDVPISPTERQGLGHKKKKKRLSKSALSLSASLSTLSPLSTPRRHKPKYGAEVESPSALSLPLSLSNHSRNALSTSNHSRRGSLIQQDSKQIASQLRAQKKHERSKRPYGAKGKRRTSRNSDNMDNSEHSFATSQGHSIQRRGSHTSGTSSPTPRSPSRLRRELLRRSSPRCVKALPILDLEGKIPPLPIQDTETDSSMTVQTRYDGTRYTVKRQQYIRKKRDSKIRKSDILASLDRHLGS